jgi:feruloyl esterase
MNRLLRLAIAAVVVSVAPSKPSLAQTPCAGLLRLTLDRTAITSATIVPAGPFAGPFGPAGPLLGGNLRLPPRCEVRGTIATTPQSQVHFALWLPLESWNGKYRQDGNSGFAGLIPYWSMVDALVRGYATAATDTGHTVSDWTEALSGAWAIGASESVVDFGHRAVHETATQAKVITARFYGRPATYSYFVGCSEGGREALMEAQRFPRSSGFWPPRRRTTSRGWRPVSFGMSRRCSGTRRCFQRPRCG